MNEQKDREADSSEAEKKGEERNEGNEELGVGESAVICRNGRSCLIRDEQSPPSVRGVFVSIFLLRGGGFRRRRRPPGCPRHPLQSHLYPEELVLRINVIISRAVC